jgi:L-threonylcarbamoyladenylate synthase
LSCDYEKPESDIIDETVEALVAGLVVVMPTETQYALSVRADNDKALEVINCVKKRSETVRAAVFIKDLEMAQDFCVVSDLAWRLADRFLPGPLTLVLPGKIDQQSVAAGFLSEDGFGIRISSSPLVSAVMQKVAFPVTATSANLSGEKSATTVSGIKRELGESVDLYLDAGSCRSTIPSTVVKVDKTLTILRPGLIGEAEIRDFLRKRIN